MGGRKSVIICSMVGALNLMFPDLRVSTAELSYCRVTRWQSGSMDIVQLLTTGTKFVLRFRVCFALPLGIESSTNMSFVHTAYLVPHWISLLPTQIEILECVFRDMHEKSINILNLKKCKI